MHPSSGCTALASARAHRVCIFVCNPAQFHPRQPLFLRALFFSLSLFLFELSCLSSSLNSRTSAYITPSLSVIFFAPISHPFQQHVHTPYVSPYSLLTFPAALIGTPLLLRTLIPVPKTLLVSSLFALLHSQGQSLPYE